MILTTKEAMILNALRSHPELVRPACHSTGRVGSVTFANLATLQGLMDKGLIEASTIYGYRGTMYTPLTLRYELTDFGRALLTQSIVLTGVILVGLRRKEAHGDE